MTRLSLFLAVAQVVLAICALISCLSAEKDSVRALPRAAWVPLIVFFPLVGSIAWFLVGRPLPDPAAGSRRSPFGGAPARGPRPPAPDDDPDFLKSLDADQARRDREMFDRWEADLRRREEDLRRREPDPPQA